MVAAPRQTFARCLYDETVDALSQNQKTCDDVVKVVVSNGDAWCTWEEFATAAKATTYSPYIGIDGNMLVLGDGWWLERERDRQDRQNWEFHEGCMQVFLADEDWLAPTPSILRT
jgi:hypothetical protein